MTDAEREVMQHKLRRLREWLGLIPRGYDGPWPNEPILSSDEGFAEFKAWPNVQAALDGHSETPPLRSPAREIT